MTLEHAWNAGNIEPSVVTPHWANGWIHTEIGDTNVVTTQNWSRQLLNVWLIKKKLSPYKFNSSISKYLVLNSLLIYETANHQ
jgi:hypothetical protein